MNKYLTQTNIARRRPQNMGPHTQLHVVVQKYVADARNLILKTQTTMKNKNKA